MLAADEHPGAFLEDELPFAPRPAETPSGPNPPDQDPWGWFQRWRVPITALFVVLIALAVALAFGAQPDDPPQREPLASGLGGPIATVFPAGDTSGGVAAGSAPSTAVAPPPAADPGSPDTARTAATAPSGASTASLAATGPNTTGPGTPPTATTRAPATTAATVPGYATGSTQARGPNDPPFIANPGRVATTVGEAVRYQIGVSARPGEVLAFRATGLPQGLGIDPVTGLVTGTSPGPETTGVQVTVTSSTGSSFTQGFTWVVTR